MKRGLLYLLVFVALNAIMLFPALVIAAWLSDRGFFGPCFEGNCAYGALFVGAPVICLALSASAFLAWYFWRRRQHG